MINNNIIYMWLLSSLFFFSCTNKLPFDETSTIALTGYVSSERGISILLSKALASNQEYYFDKTDFFINNATVRFFEEGKELFLLNFDGKGEYSYKDTLWKPEVGKKYKIQATIPDYGVVESELVLFPAAPNIEKFSYTVKRDTSSKDGAGSLFFAFELEKQQVSSDFTQYYELVNTATANNSLLIADPLANPKLTEQEQTSCGYINYGTHTYFTNTCLKNNIFYTVLSLLGRDEVGTRHLYNKLEMKVYTISEEQHKFANSFIIQDVDTRFQEVPPSYTNIKNGIGCFYARNEGKQVFVVKP
jgi:hypothetical protein